MLFTSSVNPEAFKNEKGDTTSLLIFTETVSSFLLGAEVTAVGFNTHNLTISQSIQAPFLLYKRDTRFFFVDRRHRSRCKTPESHGGKKRWNLKLCSGFWVFLVITGLAVYQMQSTFGHLLPWHNSHVQSILFKIFQGRHKVKPERLLFF